MENNVIKSGSFMIDMESIVCTDIKNEDKREKLENHLKSKDFFLVKEYPEAYLEIEESGSFEKGSAEIKAKLTIRGNTNPITFRATRQLLDDGLKFFANIIVDRTKYDVKYASGKFFDNLVDKTIYDDFILKVNLMVREE